MADTGEQGRRAAGSLVEELVIDPWAALSFKRAMGGRRQPGVSWQSPGWVGAEHARRLMAYKIRDAYARNIARFFLATGDAKKRSNHREYGDASLLVETVKAALLGDTQDIVVPGADEFNEDTGEATTENKSEIDQTEARRAASLQADLREWAEKERFKLKLVETERTAIKLGDGVYALGWDDKKKRARLRVYDPGHFFPVYDDGNEDEFPNRVHIAWEVDENVQEGDKTKVHRITWELREVDPYSLPWNDEPAELECFMSEGVWTIGADADNIDDFTEANVEWVMQPDGVTPRRDIPLGIDFIPVVHIPNTVALLEHFGSSVLDSVMQILDDIAATDTDLQQASALAGFPPLAVSKGRLEGATDDETGTAVTTYGPGTVFEVGDGTMTVLDMSAGLAALIEYVNHLLERLEVNARVPAGVLGRIKPSDVPSGIALALSFGPLRTMVDEMHLVRDDKYGLLFRFNTRLMWKNGTLTEEPPEAEANLVFGHFLVVDTTSVVNQVQMLLTAKAISRPTALKMLVEAGIPVEDAAQEIALIQSEDFIGADNLFTATNDQQLVFDYLGIDKKPEEIIPPPTAVEPVVVDPTTGEPIAPQDNLPPTQ